MVDPTPVRGHIPWNDLDLRLRAARSIWLATSRPDGRAMVAPVWYWWDGGARPPRLYFITARTTAKARNLAHHDWAEAHLGDGDDVAIVRGRTRIVTAPSELERVDDAYRHRYVDPHSGARASIYDNPADDLYRLDPQIIIAWSYGTVGTWTEWRFGTNA
jgi:nitroimidazol reductase NimA-like FMN-containing flavoprotein (pyridoxamine 5'-phosphate oxidase superfamily)